MKSISILLVTLFFFQLSTAQIPAQAISYQAMALDEAGQVVSEKSIGIRFSISQIGSSELDYQETHTVMTTGSGIFGAVIGEGSVVVGEFISLDFSGLQMQLKVELDINGGTNYTSSFEEPLHFVPYAFYAANATTVINPGLKGPQGVHGVIGQKGPQGPQGPQGPRGLNAGEGPMGSPGDIGPRGPQGDQGPPGNTLAPRGDIGLQGPQGDAGTAIGSQGPTGPQGDTGPNGPRGIPGLIGSQGPPGLKGLRGIKGPPSNEIGPTGPLGPPGENAIFFGPFGPTGLHGGDCFDPCNDQSDCGGDVNGDGIFNAADCQGFDGTSGPQGIEGERGDLVNFEMTSVSPPTNDSDNHIYIDDGSNRSDGKPGFRVWDGTQWIDL